MTPEEANKSQTAVVAELRKRFEYWQNYLAMGGYGAQVEFEHRKEKYQLSLCGQVIEIEEIGKSNPDDDYSPWKTDIRSCPALLLADASKHLMALKHAILKRIEGETAPVREALNDLPEPKGELK